MKDRSKMIEELDLLSNILMVNGVEDLMSKLADERVKEKKNFYKIGSIMTRIISVCLNENRGLIDKLVIMKTEKTQEEVDELEDNEYFTQARTALLQEMSGFFI